MDEQGNTTGVCDNPPISPPPPAALAESPGQGDSNEAHFNGGAVELRWLLGAILAMTVLLRPN